MNDMELVTDVPVIEMEMEVVTRNYPVIPNPEGTPTDDISSMEIDNVIYAVKDEEARTELENKVDKEEGKGLSEEDFTHTLKAKLDGIENGAEVNVQSDFAQSDNSADDFIKNKPTKLSDFSNDEGFIDKSVNDLENYYKKSETYTKSEVNSALDLKVDKVNGKGLSTNDYDNTAKGIVDNVTTNLATKVDKDGDKVLSDNNYSDTDKTKLDGIEAEANKTVVDTEISATSTNPVESKAIYNLLNDLLPEATATGNPIAISNASGLNAKSLKVELEPIQDLNGYDSPWVGGSGKNIFPTVVDGTYSNNGITIVAKNGVLTFSGTSTASGAISINFDNTYIFPSSDTYDFCFMNTVVTGSISMYLRRTGTDIHYWSLGVENRIVNTWASSVDESYSRLVFSFGNGVSANGTVSPMLVKKTETDKTHFAPYSNICPISGRTQTTVSVNSEDTTIQFGQTVYGGEVDVTSGGTDNKWKIINLKDLTWSKAGADSRVFRSNTISDILEPLNNNDVVEAFCSCFYVDSYADVVNSHGICCIWSASTFHGQLWCDYDYNATLDEFKEVIKNQTLCYKLATPTTINTPANEISLLKGSNTLTSDGDMELIYSKTPQ